MLSQNSLLPRDRTIFAKSAISSNKHNEINTVFESPFHDEDNKLFNTNSSNMTMSSISNVSSKTETKSHKKRAKSNDNCGYEYDKNFSEQDNIFKKECFDIIKGLPGNQLESVKFKRFTTVKGLGSKGLRFPGHEILNVCKAFALDIFLMHFDDAEFPNYMDYVKFNIVAADDDDVLSNSTTGVISSKIFMEVVQNEEFFTKMNRFIGDERNKWLNCWLNILCDRHSRIVQQSMNNLQFDLLSLPSFGIVGDTGMGAKIFSIITEYLLFISKSICYIYTKIIIFLLIIIGNLELLDN
jgi:hypothetical protein